MATLLVVLAFIAVLLVFIKTLNTTDIPRIKKLPEVPGVPIFGNLLQLGVHHAAVTARWAKMYGPVFQTRLGNRRVVFVNSYEAVRHIWMTHQSALISRPTFHTFHSIVSTSQGFTIGTSPWDESCKRKRKAAATALNRPAVVSYLPVLDRESMVSIRELWDDVRSSADGEVDPRVYFQRFSLNTGLSLNYGTRIDGNIENGLLREILEVERKIAAYRSTSNNWQDYIPVLRLWATNNTEAERYRTRRDRYLTGFLNVLKDNIKEGVDKPCIAGSILKDPENPVSDGELKSICLSMISASSETVAANITMGIATFSTPEGQAVQEKAYNAIHEVYPNGDAWVKCISEEKVPYIVALVKEVLRFWTVIPVCLPRTSIRDIPWADSVIPAGTTFFMNAWAADYDEDHFKEPMLFSPERFLGDSSDSVTGTPHFAYGAGSRMCIGTHLANRELYTAFVRLITAFKVVAPRDPREAPVINCLACNSNPTSLTTNPRPFRVGLKARDPEALKRWIYEAEDRTSGM